jgi:hypothetical protein
MHKDILPVSAWEIAGGISIFVLSALCNAAGIGGGGIMVPVLIVLFSF